MTRSLLFTLFISLLGNVVYAQEIVSKSDMILLDHRVLAEKKKKILAKDPALLPAFMQLLRTADQLLNFQPVSVMEKTELPPSGNKHDYMSVGPYWWPDSSRPGGLPYIRKDGQINPESRNYPDKAYLPRLCETVYNLSLAYYYTGNENYARHAVTLLQVWFLDTATRMNPHLNYGQGVKGITTGRAEGLIDTRHFIFLVDAIDLLKESTHWTEQNQAGLTKWFTDFLTWMQNSEIGKDEMSAKNNHGVWYDAQRLSFSLFIGDTQLANQIVLQAAGRLDRQSDQHGSFPLEMARTTSLHYTVFVMNAFIIIARLSEKTSNNFWELETVSGKSLRKSFDAIVPYITQQEKWTGKQIKPFNTRDAFPLLLIGNTKLNCKNCMEAIKSIAGDEYGSLLLNLL